MGKKIRLEEKEVSRIRHLYEEQKLSSRRIAKVLGLSREVVERVARENNLKKRGSLFEPLISKDDLLNLYITNQLSIKEISNKKQVSSYHVKRCMEVYDIEMRPRVYKRHLFSRQDLEQMYNKKNMNLKDIASIYKCSVSTVWGYMRRAGIKKQKKVKGSLTRHRIKSEDVIIKCLEGLSIKELCSYFRCCRNVIADILKQSGLSLDSSVLSNVQYDEMYQFLIVEKRKVSDVAQMYNVSSNTLNVKLKELKIDVLKEREKQCGFTEDNLRDLYYNKGLTQKEIAEKLNCSRSKVASKFKEYKIRKVFKSDTIDNNELKRLFIDENLPQIMIARKLNIPVNLISKRIDRLNLRNKRTDEDKEKSRQKAYQVCLSCRKSKGERELENLFPTEHVNVSEVIGLELDLWYSEKRVAVEYNGDYWHSTKFHRNSGLHLAKLAMCKNNKIRLINIFERDWKKSKNKEKIVTLLKRALTPSKLLDPVGCVGVVNHMQRTRFENKYNLDKTSRATKCVGIWSKKQLISSISYDVLEDRCVVSRMTTHCDYLENYDALLRYIKDSEQLPIQLKLDKRYYEIPPTALPYTLIKEIEPELFYVLNTSAKRKEDATEEYLNNPRCYSVYDCGYAIFEI